MDQLGFNFGKLKDENSIKSSSESSLKSTVNAKSQLKDTSTKDLKESDEAKIYSVSEINKEIKALLEGRFFNFWIKGEISNFKAHSSGHFYFSLKDEKSQINAVMFKGMNSKLRFRPESGMEVMVFGRVSVYEPRGNYQIFCEKMEPVGAGALQLAFDQLKSKLKKEGLFEPSIKKPIPQMCKKIAIVTSPTGAAIRDMIHVLNRRFKGAEVLVIPALVQGPTAKESIVEGIEKANLLHQKENFDVLIVGRGGGSIEDLWAFNEEIVARAIATSKIPVVSAVGHEVDYTISDFVSDLRAPTPSAAAEIVVKNVLDLNDRILFLKSQMRSLVIKALQGFRLNLTQLSKRLVDPQRKLQEASLRCDDLINQMERAIQNQIIQKKMQVRLYEEQMGTPLNKIKQASQLNHQMALQIKQMMLSKIELFKNSLSKNISLLDSLSPLKVLERGYGIVRSDNKIVRSSSEVRIGDTLQIQLHHGKVVTEVKKIN